VLTSRDRLEIITQDWQHAMYVQVIKGRDAAGVNKLLQMLAKAADVMKLDGVEALRVRKPTST
jgi:hypothetical protein